MRFAADFLTDDPSEQPLAHRTQMQAGVWSLTLLFILEAVSLGLGAWQLRSHEMLSSLVRNNEFGPGQLHWRGPGFVVAVAGGLGLGLAMLAIARWRGYLGLILSVVRGASPVLLVGLLPPLFDWRIWVDRELVHVLYGLSVVLATKKLVYFALTGPTVRLSDCANHVEVFDWVRGFREGCGRLRTALPQSLAIWSVLVGAAGYAAFFSFHTIVHHRNVLSASLDLGLEDNLVWNVLHLAKPLFKSSPLGGPTASHLGFHATWFAFVIAPFYAIRPNAETLLIIQAVLLGGASIPLFLLGRRYVSPWNAALIAFCYLLYPGLHGSNLYDFHYLPLGPFFLWFVVYFVESRRWFLAVIFVILTLSIREDVAVGLGFLGGLLLLAGRRPKDGLFLLVVGCAYFILMKGIVMHKAMGGSDAFVHQYRLLVPDGDQGFSGVVKTILSNPLYTLGTLLEKQKLIYFLQIALPLAFLPLRRPIGLWAAVPGFLFTLLSTEYPPLLSISFQYTAYWSAQLFPASLLNLRWMDQRIREGTRTSAWKTSWMAALGAATVVTSYQYGAIFQHEITMGGFGRYHFGTDASDLKRRADLSVLLKMIPPKAKVVASENIVPQLSNRPDAYTLRIAVFDADYILFRLPAPPHEREHVLEVVENDSFGIVEASGEFVLAKRGHSTARNALYLTKLGGFRHGRR